MGSGREMKSIVRLRFREEDVIVEVMGCTDRRKLVGLVGRRRARRGRLGT
jgi:hypothetical protein